MPFLDIFLCSIRDDKYEVKERWNGMYFNPPRSPAEVVALGDCSLQPTPSPVLPSAFVFAETNRLR